MRKIYVWLSLIISAMLPVGTAFAGIMDAFNRASQAVSDVENAKNTADRAGNLIPKKAPAPKKEKPAQDITATKIGESLSDKDRAAIEKNKRAWVAGFKAKDWDAVVDQYAPTAAVLPAGDLAVSGRDAIKAYFASDEEGTSNEVFKTIEINGNDKLAYVQGAFTFTLQPKDKDPVDVSGKYIEIWEKQEDGTWLITHDIWNADPVVGSSS